MSRAKGMILEGKAADFLANQGYKILERNYTTKFGEIDVIAIDKETLVFVEVKYRASDVYGMGYEAVRRDKLKKLERVIWHYIKAHACYLPHNYRLDVISIDGPDIETAELKHFINVPFKSTF